MGVWAKGFGDRRDHVKDRDRDHENLVDLQTLMNYFTTFRLLSASY